MIADLKGYLRGILPRDLLLDLFDMAGAQALKAFEMIRDYAGLDEKRARELVGQARFRMMEKGFVDVCLRHGGDLLPDGIIPGTSIRAFQPFVRFGAEGGGVVLGLASMPTSRDQPAKNQSRKAGVMLNEFLTPRLDLGDGPRPGDVFVLFLVARDRARPGMIEEVAIGVINHEYSAYMLYERLDGFLADYAPPSDDTPPPDGPDSDGGDLVRLKPRRGVFKPPEAAVDDDAEGEGKA